MVRRGASKIGAVGATAVDTGARPDQSLHLRFGEKSGQRVLQNIMTEMTP